MRVQKSDGCWLWTGHRDKNGYGRLRADKQEDETKGRLTRAPRMSWEMHFGPIPLGLDVFHTCDRPPCVRPDHLYLGTVIDNGRDIRERHQKKSHCFRGHELEGANLIWHLSKHGHPVRKCRACHNLRRSKAYRQYKSEVI